MTNDERAREIVRTCSNYEGTARPYRVALQMLSEVARSARASERERCAKVADEVGMHDDDMTSDPDDPWGSASARIAALVRSLPADPDPETTT